MAELWQFVNLDRSNADELGDVKPQRAGRNVTLIAKVKPAVAGVQVCFEMKAGPKNVVPSLEGANFSHKERRHLLRQAHALPGISTRRALTDTDGRARMTFTLSGFGGDEFEISAYTKTNSGKRVLFANKYVVWRRIYCQVSRFRAGPKGAGRGGGDLPEVPELDLGPVYAEFEDRLHNVELIEESPVPLITRRSNVLDYDLAPGDFTSSAREGYDPKREPVSLRFVLVNQIADSEETELRSTLEVSEGKRTSFDLDLVLWHDESMPKKQDWLVSADWRWDERSPWQPFDPNNVEATGRSRVEIAFPKIPKKHALHLFRSAQIRLKVRRCKGSSEGMSWYNAVWIANEAMHRGPNEQKVVAETCIHEVGHALGMVPAGQTTQYTGKDHTGSHCSEGLSPGQKNEASYGGLPGTCIMFGESGASVKGIFCPVCDESLRTRPLRIRKMPAHW